MVQLISYSLIDKKVNVKLPAIAIMGRYRKFCLDLYIRINISKIGESYKIRYANGSQINYKYLEIVSIDFQQTFLVSRK